MNRLPAVVSIWVLLGSCILSPYSNTTREPGADVEITFQGVAEPKPNVVITVEFEEPRGGWTAVGSGTLPSFGSWEVHAVVPERAWWKSPCSSANFRVRASNGLQYFGQDLVCLEAPDADPNSCIVDHILLQKPLVHAGDLDLVGQADADLYECVTRLEGNLSVVGDAVEVVPGQFAAGVTFSLPRLEEITGNLTIDGGRSEFISLPRLQIVGADLSVSLTRFKTTNAPSGDRTTRLNAPLLASVGGNVTIQNANVGFTGSSNAKDYDFGLPALTSVGGGVTVHNAVFPAIVRGLDAVSSIGGDLLYDWGVSDGNAGDNPITPAVEGLLNSLVTVGGNATLILPPNANAALSALAHVTGSLTVQAAASHAGLKGSVMPKLHDVGGDFLLQSAELLSCPAGTVYFPELQTISGALAIQGSSAFKKSLGATGASHLTVGSLEMTGTDSGRIPLFPDAVIAGSGSASFQDNTKLCPCLIDAFTAALTAGGWTGAATSSGNGTAVSCAPCPAPVTCP